MKENNKKSTGVSVRFYLWTVAFLLMLVLMMFFTIEKPYEEQNSKEVFGAISNCFFVPGVLLSGIGGLSFVNKCGGYDGLFYSFKNFGLHNLFFTNPKKKKAQSFYEYKTEKDEKGRKWFPNFLFVGLGSIGASILLLVVYFAL